MRPDTKKIVFLFPKEKDGFGQEIQFFPRKKMVLDRKTNFFLEKDGFGQENQLFPRKNMVWA